MSDTPSISLAAAPVALAAIVVGAAAAVCYGLGKGTVEGCRQVYRMCKDGQYPAERLNVVTTCLTNIAGMEKTLLSDGFTVKPMSVPSLDVSCPTDMPAISLATDGHGRDIFIVNSDSGITLVSPHLDVTYSAIGDSAANDIVTVLSETGFTVSVEKRNGEKVITGKDRQEQPHRQRGRQRQRGHRRHRLEENKETDL